VSVKKLYPFAPRPFLYEISYLDGRRCLWSCCSRETWKYLLVSTRISKRRLPGAIHPDHGDNLEPGLAAPPPLVGGCMVVPASAGVGDGDRDIISTRLGTPTNGRRRHHPPAASSSCDSEIGDSCDAAVLVRREHAPARRRQCLHGPVPVVAAEAREAAQVWLLPRHDVGVGGRAEQELASLRWSRGQRRSRGIYWRRRRDRVEDLRRESELVSK
jgi:hypothetical protein